MSITPQQAFEAVRVLWPQVTHIKIGSAYKWLALDEHTVISRSENGATIDWGDQTQYPPPEPKWRPATVEDVVKYLRGKDVVARFWSQRDEKIEGYLCGYSRSDMWRKWVAGSGLHYENCEVQE